MTNGGANSKRKRRVFSMGKLGLAFLSMAALFYAASATTTDELVLSSGGLGATFLDNVGGCSGPGCAGLSGDKSMLAGTLSISGAINGWTITVVSGVSKSPVLTPQALNVSSFTASCNSGQGCASGAAGQLEVKFSDINFDVPIGAGGFQANYSGTIAGGGVTSTSESAYFDNTNALFAETNLIGSDGPFSTASFGSTVFGSTVAAIPLYSMTLDQIFIADSSGSFFSVDGNIKAGVANNGNASVPEPGALVLFGSVLALCATRLSRRRAA
jgi:hypothetical protein